MTYTSTVEERVDFAASMIYKELSALPEQRQRTFNLGWARAEKNGLRDIAYFERATARERRHVFMVFCESHKGTIRRSIASQSKVSVATVEGWSIGTDDTMERSADHWEKSMRGIGISFNLMRPSVADTVGLELPKLSVSKRLG